MSCVHYSCGHCHLVQANREFRTSIADEERCGKCRHYAGPMRGLGDVISTVTHAVGIEPCGGCLKRRDALNKIAPNPSSAVDARADV